MAAFHGKQGKVTFATTATANVISWSIDATADVAEATIMSSVALTAATHWKDYIAGFLDWTATIEAYVDSGGLDPDLATDFWDENGIAMVLYSGMIAIDQQEGEQTRKYSGNGIISDISVSTDKNEIATVTYTVQGSGTLSVAASDAT